ncbi:MAG: 50S ribosomal protein L2 [Patescibacteria group bacterium]|jgi:large subunit ribosomal protein L2
MGFVKQYKATTPGRRFASVLKTGTTKKGPEKKLISPLKRNAGRGSSGKISVRHRGGGAKRMYRTVDFKQMRYDEKATVLAIEYDPNRTANIALIQYEDGTKSYILAPEGLEQGATVVSSQKQIAIIAGNRTTLENIPAGLFVMNIELKPGQGGILARSAGTQVQLMVIEGKHAHLKMPSGEMRMVPKEAMATIGQVSNIAHNRVRLGKAGRMRHLGFRPTVRGKAMNPVDHPHGGGEGNTPIGLKYPKTPWGKHALGVKTRRKHKKSEALILQRRKRRK